MGASQQLLVSQKIVAGSGPFTDNFNRADGPLGANWTIQLGSNMAIASNQVVTTVATTDQFAFWDADAFANNQYSKIRATQKVDGAIAAARCSSTGGTTNAYWVRKDGIHKFVNGAYTQLLSNDAAALGVNSILEIRVSGTTIERYVDGVLDGSVTDASLSSGSAGFGQYSDNGSTVGCDDWEGGDL